jgi:hypothetical protein
VKALVYGEAGHRAETKIKFGTERAELSPATLAITPGISNPRAIPSGEPGGPETP